MSAARLHVAASSQPQALGGYLKAAQVVVVAVDATEAQAPSEAQRLLSEASEAPDLRDLIRS